MRAVKYLAILWVVTASYGASADEACERSFQALKIFEQQNESANRDYTKNTIEGITSGDTCTPSYLARVEKRDSYNSKLAEFAKSFVRSCREDPTRSKDVAFYSLPGILNPGKSADRLDCQILGK